MEEYKGTYFRLLTDDFVVFVGKKDDFRKLAERLDGDASDKEEATSAIADGERSKGKIGSWFADNPAYVTLIVLVAIWAVHDVCSMVFG